MKVFVKGLILILLATGTFSSFAQENKDSTTVGQDLKKAGKATGSAVKKAAKVVGNKTAEVGAKGAATVVDKPVKTSKGPNGETVYIDKYERKYYVDKKGKRVYLK